jgi:hypothetical protein
MSSNLSALLSATFYQPGYEHLVELVHQRDPVARRRLASLDLAVYGPDGALLASTAVDPRDEMLDLDTLVTRIADAPPRVMVTFDARYDADVFPYRPHHYGYLHRRHSSAPSLYYAVNAVLGGVPDRVGATNLNNFETYIFRRHPATERYSLLLGCLARWAPVEVQVFAHYGTERVVQDVTLAPRHHVEIPLAPEWQGRRVDRVELKSLYRLASYIVGRREGSDDLVLFDHLFTYFK